MLRKEIQDCWPNQGGGGEVCWEIIAKFHRPMTLGWIPQLFNYVLFSSQIEPTNFRFFYFLITYGISKKRQYSNRMSKKKFSPFDECSCFVCLRRQNKQKKFRLSACLSVCISVCLSVWLSGCTYVDFRRGHNNFRRS